MTRFYVFSIVFQSYQDDGHVIVKGCVQSTPFTVEKISTRTRDRYISRLALNPLSYRGSSQNISELLPENTMEKCYFLKPIA